MEEQRQEQQEGYWLMQYQRLLDGAPEALKDAQVEMDWVLKDILLRVGAQKYVPHFARRRLTADDCVDYDKRDFQMLGIKDESLISLLMTEFAEYKEEQRKAHLKVAAGVDKLSEPSAPPLDLGKAAPSAGSDAVAVVRGEEAFVPSAPPAALTARIEEECVVCMENKCEMVFLACGHVCCCKKCADPLTSCPLCRATIATRILLLNSNT